MLVVQNIGDDVNIKMILPHGCVDLTHVKKAGVDVVSPIAVTVIV